MARPEPADGAPGRQVGRQSGAITDSRHSGTVSRTVQLHAASWNGMKPRIQCVRTP
jgi:hypothetical protein